MNPDASDDQTASARKHTFLLAMWEGGGTVPPELGLARRLIERGHVVHVIADPTIEAEALAAGCSFRPWREAPACAARTPEAALIRDWEDKSMMQTVNEYVETFLCGPAPRYARDTLQALDETGADVVLCDWVMIGASMAAEARGVPRIGLMPNTYILPVKGIPPMGPGLSPARGPIGHARDWAMRTMMTKMFNRGTATTNKARAELGLPPIAGLIDQFLNVDEFLVLTAEAFEFPSAHLPANVRYVGPVLDDPTWADDSSVQWPTGNDGPRVLVGLSSSFQNQGAVIAKIIAALSTLPVRAIVTLGEQLSLSDFPSTDNVTVVQSAPHGPLLKEADAIVTHCGHGTAIKAMCAGVPAVCIPMGRDQNEAAARIVARHAGVRLKTKASAAQIAAAVRKVLDDPSYREGAQTLGRRINVERSRMDPADALLAAIPTSAAARVGR